MNIFQRIYRHYATVHTHRKAVRQLCFKCGLYWQGLTHDLSKYSTVEFLNGVKFFTGTKSPHNGEREAYGYSKAWLHHKGRNKHHREYWLDRTNDQLVPLRMPTNYLIEMFCDRVAACKTYMKDTYTDDAPLSYYINHANGDGFHPDTAAQLKQYLEMLATHGEDYTLAKLKEILKHESH